MGRAPAIWTEANVKFVNEHYVPVSLHNIDQSRTDAVGQFCRDARLKLDRAEAHIYCVTAGGTVLEEGFDGFDPVKALAKFKALPEAERLPGAVKVPALGTPDAQRVAPAPPTGGIILKVYMRAFMHEGKDRLRTVTGEDLSYGPDGQKTLKAAQQNGRTAAHEAQPDHLWLTEAEWKSLVPANPKPGDKLAVPAALAERFIRLHLNPLRFYGRYGPDALDRKDVRASELALIVQTVTPQAVGLRLEGFAKLGQKPPADVTAGKVASFDAWGYEPSVLGFLDYDIRKGAFTRFDVVAIGDHFGRLGLGIAAPARVGLQPLGISFDLVTGDRPQDRLPPGRATDAKSYFDIGK